MVCHWYADIAVITEKQTIDRSQQWISLCIHSINQMNQFMNVMAGK